MFADDIDLTSFVGKDIDAATWAKLLATTIARHGPTWAWQATPLAPPLVGLHVNGLHVKHAIAGQNAPEEGAKSTVPELAF